MNLSNNRINATNNNQMQRGNHVIKGNPNTIKTLNNYGTPSRPVNSLTEGEVIKGEVTDLRNNSVIVTLEDNTSVSAQLKNGGWLAIGETAAFRVVNLSPNGVVLEPLPPKDMSLQNSTIFKALEEAGLPKNDKNKQIVYELMQHKLPINKQSIMNILQQTYQYKAASVPALVFMNKHHIPVNEQNAVWLEKYQTQNHQLLYEIENFSKGLPQMLEQLSKEVPSAAFTQLCQKLLTYISITDTHTNHVTDQPAIENSSTPVEGFLISTETAQPIFSSRPDVALPLTTSDEFIDLISILDNFQIEPQQKEAILDGNASLRQVMKLLNQHLFSALETDTMVLEENQVKGTIIMENTGELRIINQTESFSTKMPAPTTDSPSINIKSGLSFLGNLFSPKNPSNEEVSSMDLLQPKRNTNAITNPPISSTEITDLLVDDVLFDPVTQKPLNILLRVQAFSHPVVKKLYNAFFELQTNCNEIGSTLTINQRKELYDILSEFPLNEQLKEQVLTGEISTKELFSLLKNVLNFTSTEKVSELLQNTSFQNLLEKEVLDQMTLTPKDLVTKGNMEHFFDKLNERFSRYQEIIEEGSILKNLDPSQKILTHGLLQPEKQSLDSMQENLQFMKAMNQMFTYFQLPLKLQDQTVHGELYVYTKKKERKMNPQDINVLLHLDLEHLGPLDIQINLKAQQVHAKFYLENEDTLKFLRTNIFLLENALLEKGFLCQTEFTKKNTELASLENFISSNGTDTQQSNLNRYSFDIRV